MPEKEITRGRQFDQKMKPYLVYQYLLRNTDDNNTKSAFEIAAYLDTVGINAERRSIYKDIDAINKVMWMLQNKATIDEANEVIDSDKYDAEKPIVYDPCKKGFYVRNRGYDFDDIRLISECIFSSRYISEKKAKELVEIMKDFLSDDQAQKIKTDAIVTNRVRLLNDSLLDNIAIINEAMATKISGDSHKPEKISFQYLKSTINDLNHQVERKQGSKYIVSPYKLIISDGNYYLLAYDDSKQAIRTYRVDRMKSIKCTGEEREGKEEFEKIDLSTYMQRTFSMFAGDRVRVEIRFISSLLDVALEKLGREKVFYSKIDDHHFSVSAPIEISDQFFGWLCGFGAGVQITAPESVKKQFIDYIDKIRSKYNNE